MAQIGHFDKLNSTVGSVAMFFLRTLHSFSCSWPTTNNGFRSDVLAGYSVKMFQLRRSDKVYFDQIRFLRLVRAWLLHGLPGLDCWRESAAISCFLRLFEVRWPRPNIELGWPAPCRLGGGHFADLPFHRGELRSRRTENPDKRPQTKPTNTAIQSL